MTLRSALRTVVVSALGGLTVTLCAAGPQPASAAVTQVMHPLGNFTVNHYNGLRITPERVENLAIVDSAELPTLQARSAVDTDRSGTVSAAERSSYGTARCSALAAAQRLTVNGAAVAWRVTETGFVYEGGQGGLETSRLTCHLSATAKPLEAPTAPGASGSGISTSSASGLATSSSSTSGSTAASSSASGFGTLGFGTSTVSSSATSGTSGDGTVEFGDGFLADRLGWREITAVSSGGVRLARSSVPGTSVSRELRSYPSDLSAGPLDQRAAELSVVPGAASVAIAALPLVGDGPIGEALAALDRVFTGLVGTESLTVPLGLLAVLLATVLGAGHALIPGHGKTVMAAYLAGRRGRPRDALIVGATVTVTHTLGVLVVGLLLSVFSVLTGEGVLAWLGLASGLLIVLVGTRLLGSAWHTYRTGESSGHGHGHGHFGHGHGHGHEDGHAHEDGHDDGNAHEHGQEHAHGHERGDGHGHGHGHGHGDGDGGGGGHVGHEHPAGESRQVALMERKRPERREGGARSRRGLVGLGVAGGLVPSPSALIVLLGAIALGRTWFGIALVLAYGIGMAGTLTATGLLLVKLTGRLDRLATAGGGAVARLSALTPIGTAAVVVLLGLGLTVRSLTGAI
ncbi:High-affinity nickel-transporter [Streptosporangium subroseum]|uniref:High-affinity nickel-transporter n=1 Tax=Streptosporangium subroseum TaxID=106412 RepID=UPI00343F6829